MKQIYIFILSSIILIVSYITLYIHNLLFKKYPEICYNPFPISLYIPLFFSIGIIFGYLYSKIVQEHKKESKVYDILLNFLDETERQIFSEILNKKKVLQSYLSKKYGKVKVHRVLNRLENKGLIKRKEFGKTYEIILNI